MEQFSVDHSNRKPVREIYNVSLWVSDLGNTYSWPRWTRLQKFLFESKLYHTSAGCTGWHWHVLPNN